MRRRALALRRLVTLALQAGVDNNLKMAHVTKEGYGAIPDYKEIAEQTKKVAILQVIARQSFELRSILNPRVLQDEKFPIGIRVELQELKAIAHMNGRRGTVCETPEENIGRPELAGRISVRELPLK
jgi:hypothetical protein